MFLTIIAEHANREQFRPVLVAPRRGIVAPDAPFRRRLHVVPEQRDRLKHQSGGFKGGAPVPPYSAMAFSNTMGYLLSLVITGCRKARCEEGESQERAGAGACLFAVCACYSRLCSPFSGGCAVCSERCLWAAAMLFSSRKSKKLRDALLDSEGDGRFLGLFGLRLAFAFFGFALVIFGWFAFGLGCVHKKKNVKRIGAATTALGSAVRFMLSMRCLDVRNRELAILCVRVWPHDVKSGAVS